MKKLFILIPLFFITNMVMSQAEKGWNFGVGLSNNGFPVYLSYDIPVHPDIALAPEIAFNLDGFDYMSFSLKADYYFDRIIGIPEAFDFYGGLNLGYRFNFNDNAESDLDLGLEVGGRWFWNPKWGLNLELSGGTSLGTKFGLTMRL